MIELTKFPPQFGMRDASPFCLKMLTYLKLANVPHTIQEEMDSRKGPKQKFPFITDGDNVIADSELIIHYLKEKYGDPLAEGLSAEQLATGHAFSVMLAERFYWVLTQDRWLDKKYQPVLRDTWFGSIPRPFRNIVANHVFKQVGKIAEGHGIGRHAPAEIHKLGISDINAIEAQLGDKAFFLDEKPREVDASIYAFMANAACDVFPSPVFERVRSSERLMTYIDRVDEAAFGSPKLSIAA